MEKTKSRKRLSENMSAFVRPLTSFLIQDILANREDDTFFPQTCSNRVEEFSTREERSAAVGAKLPFGEFELSGENEKKELAEIVQDFSNVIKTDSQEVGLTTAGVSPPHGEKGKIHLTVLNETVF